ncbi:hypothetical protein SELMODRAFT_425834 [Selaginella moellendorffii]|uniref:Uncharacterized protein n=1 Tax=Selaginella moellendorffii TaxID=88036 RepID=D8SUG0_SELML|nr:hypothetical protein SELMODRAFT_425834 [Selaginella moellendorffii]
MRFPSLVLLVLCGILAQGQRDDNGGHRCFPAIFGFGDDWGDVGNLQALYPADLEKLEDEAPYGMSYFKKPARRLSDGRLMLDFVAQALGMPLLSSYAVGVVSNLQHGISFAVAGSTASSIGLQQNPYHLMIQIQWLQKLESDVRDALGNQSLAKTTETLPNEQSFQEGLYMISTGQNDYRYAFFRDNRTVREVERTVIPYVVENITATVLFLSTTFRAANFMVFNLPPLGCSPEFLTSFASTDPNDYDTMGCLIDYNRITVLHNERLRVTLDVLRASFRDSVRRLIYVDMAAMVTGVVYDPESRGFQNGLEACCGTGKPYNYDPRCSCVTQRVIRGRNLTARACSNPSTTPFLGDLSLRGVVHNLVALSIMIRSCSGILCIIYKTYTLQISLARGYLP